MSELDNELKKFRNDPLIKSFYKFVNDHHLRKEALLRMEAVLQMKEDRIEYEDLS